MTAKEIAYKNMPESFILEINHKEGYNRFSTVPQWMIDAMKEYAEIECNKAYRHATKVAQNNFKYGEFTVTKKILKNATDYPEAPFDWENNK